MDKDSIFILSIGLACFIFITLRAKKRKAGLSRWVKEFGFSCKDVTEASVSDDWLRFPLFKRKAFKGYTGFSGMSETDVFRGSFNGTEVTFFDYMYTVGFGRQYSVTHSQTVAVFAVGGNVLPEFELRPEHLVQEIEQIFGYKDIDFSQYPEFSRSYLLRASDEQAVRALFAPETLQFLSRQKGWAVESIGRWLMIYRHGNVVKPETLTRFLEEATNIFRLFQRQ